MIPTAINPKWNLGAMPAITEELKYYDTNTRIATSVLLIAVMGLFMGMMFPIGVALASVRHGHLLPWYWGINGAASVFASVLAVVLSLQFGIAASFWMGAFCYGICLAMVPLLKRKATASEATPQALRPTPVPSARA
jgi:MFS family permease